MILLSLGRTGSMKVLILAVVVAAICALASKKVRFYLGGALIEAGVHTQYSVHGDLQELSGEEIVSRLYSLNRWSSLAERGLFSETEHPVGLVVLCMDSRFETNRIAADSRTELFYKVRTPGSVLSPDTADGIELAVVKKGIRLVLFTYHDDCAAEGVCRAHPHEFPGLRDALHARFEALQNFMERPEIAKRLKDGSLTIKVAKLVTGEHRLEPKEIKDFRFAN